MILGEKNILIARNELYLAMRYLFLPLNSLEPAEDKSTFLLATDGSRLLYNPIMIEQKSEVSQVLVNRAYLHSVLHCMFSHPFVRPDGLDSGLWDIACDAAVEYIIDGLELRCVRQLISERREEIYRLLEREYPVISAGNVYRYLSGLEQEERDQWEAAGIFTVDDHKYWYSSGDDDDGSNDVDRENGKSESDESGNGADKKLTEQMCRELKARWEQTARRSGSEMEAIARSMGDVQSAMSKALRPETDKRMSYSDFLRRFAVTKEEMHVDLDAFDYGFYNYGLMTYENMPIIEELEYREEQRIEDLVVVIDTSGSCSGRTVKRFIDETLAVLSAEDTFADRTRIHIVQCDNRIQSDTVIRSKADIRRFEEEFEVRGFGGTDFRPAFEYVKELMDKKEITNMKGLIYFTDGHGIYPKARTPYKTAFIFPEEDGQCKNVPPWAMKLVLGKAF